MLCLLFHSNLVSISYISELTAPGARGEGDHPEHIYRPSMKYMGARDTINIEGHGQRWF